MSTSTDHQDSSDSVSAPASSRNVRRGLDEAAGLIVASGLAALSILLADRLWRPDWDFRWVDHWKGAPVLFLAPAAIIGVLWVSVRLAAHGLSLSLASVPTKRDWARSLVVGLIAAAGVGPVALSTFSGARVRDTWSGTFGPPVFVLGVCCIATFCTLLLWRSQRHIARHRFKGGTLVACAFLMCGSLALWLDMNLFVELYDDIHGFLEFAAFCFFFAAYQLLGFILIRRSPQTIPFNRVLAASLLLLALSFVGHRPLRTWTDGQLAHAWVDKFYVGRNLRRAQELELGLGDGGSLKMARMDLLARKYDIKDSSLAAEWLAAPEPSSPLPQVRNVIFFYVDTLRADVAQDPVLMPALQEFRRESLDFARAYASGSDTLRSLPTITRGNYFIDKSHDGDLLSLARLHQIPSTLIIAESARDFLEKLLPSFRFDHTETVVDHDSDEDVWGYGAHISTANGVGDKGVNFIKSERAQSPFLLWLFHFDAHAWRELDDDYIKNTRERFGVRKTAPLNVRYRVVARSIDHEFSRIIEALRETGRDKDTAVVFLSDHGEALGQGGFWVHSIFLWESLIHVPLVMRIPGVSPRKTSDPVSLVDIAPTIAPILGADAPMLYHGDSLIELSQGKPRRLPIVLRGGTFDGQRRAGIVEPVSQRKLVVRLEAAFPELHAYLRDPDDRRNLARLEPERVQSMMKRMARTPVYPRADADFTYHEEAKELDAGELIAR